MNNRYIYRAVIIFNLFVTLKNVPSYVQCAQRPVLTADLCLNSPGPGTYNSTSCFDISKPGNRGDISLWKCISFYIPFLSLFLFFFPFIILFSLWFLRLLTLFYFSPFIFHFILSLILADFTMHYNDVKNKQSAAFESKSVRDPFGDSTKLNCSPG